MAYHVLYQPLLASAPLYSLALLLALAFHFNLLFLLPSFASLHSPPLSALFFITSLLSCNQKWKACLFALTSAVALFPRTVSGSPVLALGSLLMATVAHRNLVFASLRDNLHYFVGFFAVGLTEALVLLGHALGLHLSAVSLLSVAVAAAWLGHAVILARFEALRNGSVLSARDSRVVAHCLSLQKGDFANEYFKTAKLKSHSRDCSRVTCFCKTPAFEDKASYFTRQMYEDAVSRFRGSNDPLLSEMYIDFLIDNEQVTKALHYLSCWDAQGYFANCALLRCEARVVAFLEKENNANNFEKEYSYALEYDAHCLHVITEINAILQLKVAFWKEASREAPLLRSLQSNGCEVVRRMFELNCFYCDTVKLYEGKLFNYDSTVLYAMYLISTTNFKDYAKNIIKNTAKQMEEVNVTDNNAAETYAIRATVENSKVSYL